MNSSHFRTFKYIGFVSSHYFSAINMDDAPSFNVFSKFGYMSQSNILLV